MLSKVNPIQSKCGTRIDTSEEIIANELEQNVKSVQSAKSQLNQNIKREFNKNVKPIKSKFETSSK